MLPRTRTIPLDAEMVEALKRQAEAFQAKFGRPPGPNDPVFFNPDRDVPEFKSEQQIAEHGAVIADAMRKADVSPAAVYAYEKLGFIATAKNWSLLDAEQRQEWREL